MRHFRNAGVGPLQAALGLIDKPTAIVKRWYDRKQANPMWNRCKE
jgi:hypothetical protein